MDVCNVCFRETNKNTADGLKMTDSLPTSNYWHCNFRTTESSKTELCFNNSFELTT